MDPLTALMIGSTAMQAVGAVSQGEQQAAGLRQQANAADYNAKVADNQQRSALDAGTQNELAKRRSNAQMQGAQRAAVADSGFVSDSGSALDVQQQSTRDMELDALQQRYQGLLQGSGFESQGVMDRYTGKTLRTSASNARTSGYMSAAGSLLSGSANAYAAHKGINLKQKA